MSVYITYFVHGTTTDNINKLATGWLDGELSEIGIERVNELKKIINEDEFDVVFCSDLKRAVDSSEILFKGSKDIILDDRLRECNYGVLNGKSTKLINYSEHIDVKFENGENMLDVEKRVREFCDFIKENYSGKRVAIVAHRATQLALDVITKNISWEQAIENDWRNTKSWKPGWKYEIH